MSESKLTADERRVLKNKIRRERYRLQKLALIEAELEKQKTNRPSWTGAAWEPSGVEEKKSVNAITDGLLTPPRPDNGIGENFRLLLLPTRKGVNVLDGAREWEITMYGKSYRLYVNADKVVAVEEMARWTLGLSWSQKVKPWLIDKGANGTPLPPAKVIKRIGREPVQKGA